MIIQGGAQVTSKSKKKGSRQRQYSRVVCTGLELCGRRYRRENWDVKKATGVDR